MEQQDSNPLRIAKYFEEHVRKVLESLEEDPGGMYQVVYRVGDLIVSAHVWRESANAVFDALSQADVQFLRDCRVSADETSSDVVY